MLRRSGFELSRFSVEQSENARFISMLSTHNVNLIFDVGANNGLDGLGFALHNPAYNVYAFEANPELIPEIIKNKKKIEVFFKLELKNYEIINKAISDFNGMSDFHVSQFNLCSSLLKYKFVETKKKNYF